MGVQAVAQAAPMVLTTMAVVVDVRVVPTVPTTMVAAAVAQVAPMVPTTMVAAAVPNAQVNVQLFVLRIVQEIAVEIVVMNALIVVAKHVMERVILAVMGNVMASVFRVPESAYLAALVIVPE